MADRLGRKRLGEPWLQLLAHYDTAVAAVLVPLSAATCSPGGVPPTSQVGMGSRPHLERGNRRLTVPKHFLCRLFQFFISYFGHLGPGSAPANIGFTPPPACGFSNSMFSRDI